MVVLRRRETWRVDPDGWLPFVAAIAGAVVGAVASLAGTVWVQRRELKRSVRLRMFDELLPRLRTVLGSERIEGSFFVVEHGASELEDLRRCAAMAGKREQELVSVLQRCVNHLMRPRTEEEGPEVNEFGTPLGLPERQEDWAAVEDARRQLEDYLQRKLV